MAASPRLQLSLAAFFLLASLALPSAAESSTPVELEVQPASIEICGPWPARARVVARNKTKDELTGVRLSWVADGNPVISSEPPAGIDNTLPAEAEAVWLLSVNQPSAPLVPGIAHVRIDYSAAGIKRVGIASLEVKRRNVEHLAQIARAEIKTTLTSLSDKGEGLIYVVITNMSQEPLTVKQAVPRAPTSIIINRSQETAEKGSIPNEALSKQPQVPFVIVAGESKSLSFDVRGGNDVQAGKHLVLWEVDVETSVRGCPQLGTLVASHEIEVGVFGESAILMALGIPSLFLLPGFLMIVAASLLWKLGVKPPDVPPDREFVLVPKTPEFWLVSITISLLIAYSLPWMGWDFQAGYGLGKLQALWLASAVLGAVLFLATVALLRLWHRWKESRRWSHLDTPIALLRKMGERKLGPMLVPVSAQIDGSKVSAFLLEDGEKDWICPAIEVLWSDEPGELRGQVDAELNEKGSCSKLADHLTNGEADKRIQAVKWSELRGPRSVPRADVTPTGGREPLVREAL